MTSPPLPAPSPDHGDTGDDSKLRSVHAVLRDIQSGALDPKLLPPEDRQQCVEHFTTEGYSVQDMVEILKVSTKTIQRDRKDIRKRNAVTADPALAAEVVGELCCEANNAIARVARIARDRDTPPAVKLEADKARWLIRRELTEALQKLGYLPNVGPEVRGELMHHIHSDTPLCSIHEEVVRVTSIQQQSQTPDSVASLLAPLNNLITQLTTAQSESVPVPPSSQPSQQSHSTGESRKG